MQKLTGRKKLVSGPAKPILPFLFLKFKSPGLHSTVIESELGGWVFSGIFILKKYLHRTKE